VKECLDLLKNEKSLKTGDRSNDEYNLAVACAGAQMPPATLLCLRQFSAEGGWTAEDLAKLCARATDIGNLKQCIGGFQTLNITDKSELATLCGGTQDGGSAALSCFNSHPHYGPTPGVLGTLSRSPDAWETKEVEQLCGGARNVDTINACVKGFQQAGGWNSTYIAEICSRAEDLSSIYACFTSVRGLHPPLFDPESACVGAKKADDVLPCLNEMIKERQTYFNSSVLCSQ
jgi:hypothetical protein